jgi:hypothetical protein
VLRQLFDHVLGKELQSVSTDTDEASEAMEEQRFASSDSQESIETRYRSCEILSFELDKIDAILLENPSILERFWEFLDESDQTLPAPAGNYFCKVNISLINRMPEFVW